MHPITRAALVVTAALAVAAALPARADSDRWEHGDRGGPPAPYAPAAPYAQPAPAYAPPAAVSRVVPAPPWNAPAYAAGPYARVAYRDLRGEYARLDASRARFYATWNGNPWRRDRFESQYAARRAELDHRYAELASYRGTAPRWEHRR